MRDYRPIHLLTAATAFALFAGCSSNHARHEHDTRESVTTVEWDSGPLDRDYQRERSAMESRHRDEVRYGRTDETATQRDDRQESERRDLEDRYERGKRQHLNKLPPSNHQ